MGTRSQSLIGNALVPETPFRKPWMGATASLIQPEVFLQTEAALTAVESVCAGRAVHPFVSFFTPPEPVNCVSLIFDRLTKPRNFDSLLRNFAFSLAFCLAELPSQLRLIRCRKNPWNKLWVLTVVSASLYLSPHMGSHKWSKIKRPNGALCGKRGTLFPMSRSPWLSDF